MPDLSRAYLVVIGWLSAGGACFATTGEFDHRIEALAYAQCMLMTIGNWIGGKAVTSVRLAGAFEAMKATA